MKLSGLDSCKGSRTGNIIFAFPDGCQISVNDPTMKMTGLLSSNKTLKIKGQMALTDTTNNLVAEFEYAPKAPEEKKSAFGSLITAFTPRRSKKPVIENPIKSRSDYFSLKI